jgi:histidinol phosphatase-like PHP family hydrolase
MAKWECDAIKNGQYEYLGDDPIYGLRFNQPPKDADFSPFIDIDEEMIKRFGIEYTIAGTHWPLALPNSLAEACEDLYTQMMYLAKHPLVDILAHPWYPLQVAHNWRDWQGLGSLPKFDKSIVDFSVLTKIPDWMNEDIGKALVENNTCAEINSSVLNEYRCPSEYRNARWKTLTLWKEMGVKFTFGTDLHAAHTVNADIAACELLLDLYGFTEDDIQYGFPKKCKSL